MVEKINKNLSSRRAYRAFGGIWGLNTSVTSFRTFMICGRGGRSKDNSIHFSNKPDLASAPKTPVMQCTCSFCFHSNERGKQNRDSLLNERHLCTSGWSWYLVMFMGLAEISMMAAWTFGLEKPAARSGLAITCTQKSSREEQTV